MKLLLTVQYIPDRDSRVMDEVGFRILRVGFRIPGTGFRIPKPWIPDSRGKKMLDSGFPYMGRPFVAFAENETETTPTEPFSMRCLFPTRCIN